MPPMIVRPGIGTLGMSWYDELAAFVTCKYG
jgi:hypothetical protein